VRPAHRCDKTCEPKTEDPTAHHLPAVQLDDDLLPGRHPRSGSSTTARHAPPPAATLRLTSQPWRRSTDRLSDGTEVHAKPRGRRILGLRVAWRHTKP
jgi:hypothetical protein